MPGPQYMKLYRFFPSVSGFGLLQTHALSLFLSCLLVFLRCVVISTYIVAPLGFFLFLSVSQLSQLTSVRLCTEYRL